MPTAPYLATCGDVAKWHICAWTPRCIGQPQTVPITVHRVLQMFRPITVERPKALLPLVNVPMITYTLEWLVASGVEEVQWNLLHTHGMAQLSLPAHDGRGYTKQLRLNPLR